MNYEPIWKTLCFVSEGQHRDASGRIQSGRSKKYAPQSPEDELDDRFVEACHMIEYVNDLLDVLMFAELKQRVKAVDMLLKDGTITALEQRLRRLEKEVQHRGEERAIA